MNRPKSDDQYDGSMTSLHRPAVDLLILDLLAVILDQLAKQESARASAGIFPEQEYPQKRHNASKRRMLIRAKPQDKREAL